MDNLILATFAVAFAVALIVAFTFSGDPNRGLHKLWDGHEGRGCWWWWQFLPRLRAADSWDADDQHNAAAESGRHSEGLRERWPSGVSELRAPVAGLGWAR